MLPRRPPVALILSKAQTQSEEVIRALRVVRERANKRLAGHLPATDGRISGAVVPAADYRPSPRDFADIDPLEASSACLETSDGRSDTSAVAPVKMGTERVTPEWGTGTSVSPAPSRALEEASQSNFSTSAAPVPLGKAAMRVAPLVSLNDATNQGCWPPAPGPSCLLRESRAIRPAAVPLMEAVPALHSVAISHHLTTERGVAALSSAAEPAPAKPSSSYFLSAPGEAPQRDAALVTCKRELRTLRKGMRQLRAESTIMLSRTADELTRLATGTRAALQCSIDQQRRCERQHCDSEDDARYFAPLEPRPCI